MSSKNAKRNKRKEHFRNYDEEKYAHQGLKKKAPPVVQLPGQRFVRIGGALLLIGGLLSAVMVYFAINNLKTMNTEDFMAITEAAGQTPMLYLTSIVLTSIAAVFQLAFGYAIFRNARNPFYWKKTMIMAGIMMAIEVGINLYIMSQSATGLQMVELAYGCIIPGFIIWGAYRNKAFAQNHPDYVPPEPTQMF